MDYYKVMKLLYDVYLSENSENTVSGFVLLKCKQFCFLSILLTHKKIDQQHKEAIFCNLQQIMNLSSNLLNDFELNILNKSFEEVKIGQCFIKNANLIRQTYAYYAQYIEYSNNILEKVSNQSSSDLVGSVDDSFICKFRARKWPRFNVSFKTV
jgi:hypothetical protein